MSDEHWNEAFDNDGDREPDYYGAEEDYSDWQEAEDKEVVLQSPDVQGEKNAK